jgi:hypothetical protein
MRRSILFALAGAVLLVTAGCQNVAPPTAVPDIEGEFDLLVIADQPFLEALQPFVVHKRDTGIATELVSWQSLVTDFSALGDDAPERLKRAIAAYQDQAGVTMVMLVGDADRLPVRYCRAIHTEWGSKYYPSDLYYADLYAAGGAFDRWDGDGDGVLCEMDFAGGTVLAQVNLDGIDLVPDVALGRVPASSVGEVETYVAKVLDYEFAAYQAAWFERALLVVDGGPTAFGDEGKMDALAGLLGGWDVEKRYHDLAPYAGMDDAGRADVLTSDFDAGAGLVVYYGHGNRHGWSGWFDRTDAAALANPERLPVVFAASCYTGRFHTAREYYRTAADSEWNRLTGPWPQVDYPEPMAVQPWNYDGYDNESLAEQFLVRGDAGAIAYVGSVSKVEHGIWIAPGHGLAHAFVAAYHPGATLGAMWQQAMSTFVQDEVIPHAMDWYRFIHVHKVMLFGDPSLRVGGVSRIQKGDVAGVYTMVHDGWRGTLSLQAEPDDPIEQLPNLSGTWTSPEGDAHGVRGYMRTWSYPLPPAFGPDHAVALYVDFADTPSWSDDQAFEGLLFGWTRDAIAGVTTWGGTPFGFYALKDGGASVGGPPGSPPGTPITKLDFVGTYAMNHDGWRGTLTLWAQDDDPIEQLPNLRGSYVPQGGGPPRDVRGWVRTPTYPLDPGWGPGHKIELRIDFAGTLDADDDQRFDGYLFTRTRDAMAGVTWWHDRPFGFYAVKQVP